MTGKDWDVIKDPAERLIGVRSASDLEPFKQTGFPAGLETFEGKTSYLDWQFVYIPERKAEGKPQGAAGPASTAPVSPNPPGF
jgi:hypothetical protein